MNRRNFLQNSTAILATATLPVVETITALLGSTLPKVKIKTRKDPKIFYNEDEFFKYLKENDGKAYNKTIHINKRIRFKGHFNIHYCTFKINKENNAYIWIHVTEEKGKKSTFYCNKVIYDR